MEKGIRHVALDDSKRRLVVAILRAGEAEPEALWKQPPGGGDLGRVGALVILPLLHPEAGLGTGRPKTYTSPYLADKILRGARPEDLSFPALVRGPWRGV